MGKMGKAKAGHIVHGPAAYGWDYVPVTKGIDGVKIPGKWVINESEAEVVKKIFEWVGVEGLTIRKVIKRLHEKSYLPRKSQRGYWNNSTLSRMLRSEAYIGKAYYNKSQGILPAKPFKQEKYKKHPKSSRRVRSREEWYPIPVPQILPQDLFDRVQKQLGINTQFAMRNKKHDYLLSGLGYCGCGARMGCEGGLGHGYYYRCEDRLKTYPLDKRCLAGGVNCLRVDGVVWERIKNLMTDQVLVRNQAQRWLAGQGKTVFDVSGELRRLEELLSRLDEEEKRRVAAYSQGLFSLEAVTAVMAEHKKRKAELKTKLAKVREKQQQTDNRPKITVDEVADRVTALVKTLDFNDKRTLLVKLIDGIIINQERTEVKIRGFIPLEINTNINRKVEYGSISRDCGTAECGEKHPV
jgi:site-specific DNA recombinase